MPRSTSTIESDSSTCPSMARTTVAAAPCGYGMASTTTRPRPHARANGHRVRHLRPSTHAAAARPMSWDSSVQPKAQGSAQPESAARRAMFWNTTSWRNRKGPMATHVSDLAHGTPLAAPRAAASPWAPSAGWKPASSTHWASTRKRVTRRGARPDCQAMS